jgi:hypothetical protein
VHEEDDFFLYNSKNIYQKSQNFDFIVNLQDDAIVNLQYFTGETKAIEIYINNERHTKQEFFLTSHRDHKKIFSAIRANYVHTLDAALVR